VILAGDVAGARAGPAHDVVLAALVVAGDDAAVGDAGDAAAARGVALALNGAQVGGPLLAAADGLGAAVQAAAVDLAALAVTRAVEVAIARLGAEAIGARQPAREVHVDVA